MKINAIHNFMRIYKLPCPACSMVSFPLNSLLLSSLSFRMCDLGYGTRNSTCESFFETYSETFSEKSLTIFSSTSIADKSRESSHCLMNPFCSMDFRFLPRGTRLSPSVIKTTVTLRGLIRVAFFFCFCLETTHSSSGLNFLFIGTEREEEDVGKSERSTFESASDGFSIILQEDAPTLTAPVAV